jgi:hypothetical protein
MPTSPPCTWRERECDTVGNEGVFSTLQICKVVSAFETLKKAIFKQNWSGMLLITIDFGAYFGAYPLS